MRLLLFTMVEDSHDGKKDFGFRGKKKEKGFLRFAPRKRHSEGKKKKKRGRSTHAPGCRGEWR